MRLFRFFFVILLIIIVLFLIIALFLPGKVRMNESVEINSPVEVVFNQVNNLKNWVNWTPFMNSDPDFETSISNISEGVGASMKWENIENDDYGNIELTDVVNNRNIDGNLNFKKLKEVNAIWDFESTPQSTIVEWSLNINDLSYPFGRWEGLFIKSRLRPYFQDGLENLKAICENIALTSSGKWQTTEPVEKNVSPVIAFSIKDSCTASNFSMKFRQVYGEIYNYMQKMKVEQSGSPFCIYYNWNPEGITVFEAGIPISKNVTGKGRVVLSELSGGKTVMVSQYGPYESVISAHQIIDKYLKDNNKTSIGYPWEVFITDPSKEADTSKWETQIYYPID